MATINDQNTKPGTRYVKPDLPKGDFASGEHELPISTAVGDFASGEHTPPVTPEQPVVVLPVPLVSSAFDHKE
jgi:hypothetical protein